MRARNLVPVMLISLSGCSLMLDLHDHESPSNAGWDGQLGLTEPSLLLGHSVDIPVSASFQNFTGELSVSAENLPLGVTAPAVTLSRSNNAAWITLFAANNAQQGIANISVVFRGGATRITKDAQLLVRDSAGTVDPTYGYADAAIPGVTTANPKTATAAWTLDGAKMVLVARPTSTTYGDLFYARFLEDGKKDSAFGTIEPGVTYIHLGTMDFANPVQIFPDNENYTVIGAYWGGGVWHSFTAKIDASGALQSSYNNGGIALRATPLCAEGMTPRAVLTGDNLWLTLTYGCASNGNLGSYLMSNTTGADLSSVSSVYSSFNVGTSSSGMVRQSTGKAVVSTSKVLVRLTSQGTLDTSFGNATDHTVACPDSNCYGLTILPNDDLLVISQTAMNTRITHVEKNGASSNSLVVLDPTSLDDLVGTMAIDGDYVLAAGKSGTAKNLFISRFRWDTGAMDSTFGKNGTATFSNISMAPSFIGIQPNSNPRLHGRYLVAGQCGDLACAMRTWH